VTTGCAVCGGNEIEEPVLGALGRCRTCGYVFLPRTPDLPDRLRALYEGDYFTGAEFGDYASQRPTFARNFQDTIRRMRDAGAASGRLLEVGCAYGFFLEQARADFEAVGIDVNAAAIEAARGLGVDAMCVEFLDYVTPDTFDVVCLWDTIEHVLEPRAYLEKARDLLRPDGMLFLTTGDIGSLVARLRGRKWRMIHPPSHLNYFSRVTMTRLLQSVGFDVVSVGAIGTRRDLLNTLHLLALFSKTAAVRRTASMFERLLAGRVPSISLYANLHDVMFVTARRRGSQA
jgi:SAM-dependent methyltransferase